MRRPRGSHRQLLTYYYFPTEALVTVDSGEQAKPINFLIDMGATYSVLNTKLTKKSLAAMMVTGVTRQLQTQVFLQLLE